MKAVVVAGGKGTRLAPYTKVLPTPMMPMGDMPILEILLRQMKRAGVDKVILTVGHLAGLLRAFFQQGENLGLNIRYSYQEEPLGTAGPFSMVEGLDDTFIVTNHDVLTALDLPSLIDSHRASGVTATIAKHTRNMHMHLGVIRFNGSNQIIGYIEKPTYEFQVSMGIYIFEPRVLMYIPCNPYLDFPDLILRLIENGERVNGYPFDGYWQDLGRPDDYSQAVQDFESLRPLILGEN